MIELSGTARQQLEAYEKDIAKRNALFHPGLLYPPKYIQAYKKPIFGINRTTFVLWDDFIETQRRRFTEILRLNGIVIQDHAHATVPNGLFDAMIAAQFETVLRMDPPAIPDETEKYFHAGSPQLYNPETGLNLLRSASAMYSKIFEMYPAQPESLTRYFSAPAPTQLPEGFAPNMWQHRENFMQSRGEEGQDWFFFDLDNTLLLHSSKKDTTRISIPRPGLHKLIEDIKSEGYKIGMYTAGNARHVINVLVGDDSYELVDVEGSQPRLLTQRDKIRIAEQLRQHFDLIISKASFSLLHPYEEIRAHSLHPHSVEPLIRGYGSTGYDHLSLQAFKTLPAGFGRSILLLDDYWDIAASKAQEGMGTQKTQLIHGINSPTLPTFHAPRAGTSIATLHIPTNKIRENNEMVLDTIRTLRRQMDAAQVAKS